MKIAFYSTKPYDRIYFEPMSKEYDIEIHFFELPCNEETIPLANGYDAVCVFVASDVNEDILKKLHEYSVSLILLRCKIVNRNVMNLWDLQYINGFTIYHITNRIIGCLKTRIKYLVINVF